MNNDIITLAQQLRKAAKKATKGPWIAEREHFHNNGNLAGIYVDQGGKGRGGCVLECFSNCLVHPDSQVKNNALYVALANPVNISLIIDALEAAQLEINKPLSIGELLQRLSDQTGENWGDRYTADVDASKPVVPETLPCNVLLEPGLRFGKGIKTTTLLSALERRAEYEKEAKNETPEQKEQRLKAFFELMGLAGAQTVKRSVYDSEKWQLVPIEPTEDMIVDGFESEPHEAFSSEGGWREYQEMSGCSKAAHRAKLCWAAMLNAAPALQDDE